MRTHKFRWLNVRNFLIKFDKTSVFDEAGKICKLHLILGTLEKWRKVLWKVQSYIEIVHETYK